SIERNGDRRFLERSGEAIRSAVPGSRESQSVKWNSSMYGKPEPLGVIPDGSGVNVAVYSPNADTLGACFLDAERETRRVRLRGRTGDVFHDRISDVPTGTRYGLRAYGSYRPDEGHYFNPARLLIDPYARSIDRPLVLHRSMLGSRDESPGNS